MAEPRSDKPSFFEDLKRYVGFTEASTAALRALRPLAAPHFPRIVDDFYGTMKAHPGARAAITGGEPQIAALKRTLIGWLETLLSGPHDEAYFESRARIGHVHVRIELPQAYMFTAMNRIRVRLFEVVERDGRHLVPAARDAMSTAVQQILDLDLAIMLETYREDLLIKNQRAERLATIGQLAAGIGHELRNPLTIIGSSSFLLRQRLGPAVAGTPAVGKHLDRIEGEVTRASRTIHDLLALVGNRPLRRLRTPVKAIAEAAIAACLLAPGVEVAISIPPDLTAELDPDQMRHVFANLLTNASQAMGGLGQVEVAGRAASGAIEFRVRDDGPGVPDPIRHQVFEPLFTTKAHGTGIGLALCRRIVEAHGGRIELEPTDRGASFLIRIPGGPGAAAR